MNQPAPTPHILNSIKRCVQRLRAAELLTRQPLDRLPLLRWQVTAAGVLHGTADDREAFDVWARHLGLTTTRRRGRGRRRRGGRRLRARGQVDGITVTLTLQAAIGEDRRAA